MSSITSCSVTAPAKVDADGIAVAVGERQVSQGPQPLTSVEVGEQHGFSPPRIWLPVTVPALAGIDRQPQIAGRGGTGGIGDRERAGGIGGRSRVGDHKAGAVGGDRGLQLAVALASICWMTSPTVESPLSPERSMVPVVPSCRV